MRDTDGAIDTQTFTINVVEDSPPTIELEFVGETAVSPIYEADEIVTIDTNAFDDFGLQADGIAVTLHHDTLFQTADYPDRTFIDLEVSNEGIASWGGYYLETLTQNEVITVKGAATDTGGQTTLAEDVTFTISPVDLTKPRVSILNPQPDQTLTESVAINATIFDGDDNLTSYTLNLLDSNGALIEELASQTPDAGQSTLVGYDIQDGPNYIRTLAQLDPTQYANGFYSLELTATDLDGKTDTSTTTFEMDSQFELADFEVSFEDLRIPVRGFPIVVTRTYDSGDAETSGDFGYGWNLDFSDVKIDIKYPDGVHYDLGVPAFEDGVRVEVTYGDDRTEGYTFYGNRVNNSMPFGLPIGNYYYPRFQPDEGVKNNLLLNEIVLTKSFNGRSYYAVDAQRSARSQSAVYNPTDPTFNEQIQLQRRDGTSMFFNATSGKLSQIETSTGETLTFSEFGIESSEGRNVDFVRDDQDRITNIIDPDGRVLTYSYDSKGNLESFTNRNADAPTTFQYNILNITFEHYLTDIIDPLGRSSVRTFYDDAGRIDYIIDADNKVLDYLYESDDADLVPDDFAEDAAAIVATLEQLDNGQAIYSVVHSDHSRNVVRSETTLVENATFALDGDGILRGQFDLNSVDRAQDTEITITQYTLDDQVSRSVTVIGEVDGFDPVTGLTSTETNDLVTTNQYDPDHGQLTVSTDVRGNETRYKYYGDSPTVDGRAANRMFETTDQFGNTTRTPYYSITGQLLGVYTNDSSSSFNYNKSPDVQWIDSNGVERRIQNQYNEFGDVTSTADKHGNFTRFEYDANGNQSAVIRTVGVDDDFDRDTLDKFYYFRTETDYDLEDRVTQTRQYKILSGDISTPGNWVLLSSSDASDKNALGQNVSGSGENYFSVAGQNPTSGSIYDLRGQTIETTRTAFGTDGIERTFTSRSTYDAKGRVVYSTDEYLLPLLDGGGNELAPGTADSDIYGSRSFYDAQGRAIKSQRLKGVVIDIDTVAEQSALSTTAPAPVVLSWSATDYDNAGRVVSSTSYNTASEDPATGLTTTYFYNTFGETTKTVSESWNGAGTGKVTMTTLSVYNSHGQVSFSQDAYLDGSGDPTFGTETKFDDRGRSIGSIRYENPVVNFDSVTGETTLASVGDRLFETKTIYGKFGLVAQSVAADGQVTTYEYDEHQRRTATIGSPVETRIETSPGVYEIRVVQHRTETVYGTQGRVEAERSNIIHNGLGHNEHDYSQMQETRFYYDENGNVVQTEFHDGSYARVRYDELGRKIAESQQVAGTVALDWSDAEESFVDTNATAGSTGYIVPTRLSGYDSQGRLSKVTLPDPDPTDNDAQRPVYQYGYDFRGQQISIMDPLGRETNLEYDELGRQAERQLPLHTDTTPFAESWSYDARGRQSLQVTFEGKYLQRQYDNVTRRLVTTNYHSDESIYNAGIANETYVYHYDDYGRQIGTDVREYQGIGSPVIQSESMSYDDRGQLEQVTNDQGTIRYRYDDLGRQIEVAFSGIGFQPVDIDDFENVTTYSYDELGRLETVTAVKRDNQPVTDVNLTVTGDQADLTRYVYDLSGSMAATIYANGISHSYQYDDLNRLTELIHFRDTDSDGIRDDGEAIMVEFDYQLRADGKRVGAVEKYYEDGKSVGFGGPDGLTQQITYAWVYDDANRLISETATAVAVTMGPYTPDDPFTDYVLTWEYDLTGNRTEQVKTFTEGTGADETTDYVYDDNDRLTIETLTVDGAVTETAYGYDQTQQTSKVVTESGVQTRSQTFTYNLQGRMSLVTETKFADDGVTPQSVTRTQYTYDSSGNRVSATVRVDADGDGTFESTKTTEYLTDSRNHTGYSQVLQETTTDATGNVKKIIYTIGHDQINQTVYEGADTNSNGTKDGWGVGETHFFGTDGHGSVRVLYDLAATIANDLQNSALQIFHFDAYGNLLNFTDGVTPLTTYLYSGEAFDFNINQQYLRARWYDAQNGRFNRLDPFFGNLSDPQSLHKYAYVHGDPIQMIDPSGNIGIAGLGGFFTGLALNTVTAATSVGTLVTVGAGLAGLGALYGANRFGLIDTPAAPPGFAEGLVPFFGSGKAFLYDINNGNYGRATVDGFFFVTDAFLLRSIVSGIGQAGFKRVFTPGSGNFIWGETLFGQRHAFWTIDNVVYHAFRSVDDPRWALRVVKDKFSGEAWEQTTRVFFNKRVPLISKGLAETCGSSELNCVFAAVRAANRGNLGIPERLFKSAVLAFGRDGNEG